MQRSGREVRWFWYHHLKKRGHGIWRVCCYLWFSPPRGAGSASSLWSAVDLSPYRVHPESLWEDDPAPSRVVLIQNVVGSQNHSSKCQPFPEQPSLQTPGPLPCAVTVIQTTTTVDTELLSPFLLWDPLILSYLQVKSQQKQKPECNTHWTFYISRKSALGQVDVRKLSWRVGL